MTAQEANGPVGKRRRAGFTLVEMVTVMVILAIVAAAVGVPTLAYIGSVRSRAASARITTDVRFVQRLALSAGLRTWVVLSTGSNNYRLYVEDPANPGKAGRKALTHPFDQTTAPIQFGSGAYQNVSIAAVNINSTTEIEFDSFGVPYDGAGVKLATNGTISLSNGVIVTVYPETGCVERAG